MAYSVRPIGSIAFGKVIIVNVFHNDIFARLVSRIECSVFQLSVRDLVSLALGWQRWYHSGWDGRHDSFELFEVL